MRQRWLVFTLVLLPCLVALTLSRFLRGAVVSPSDAPVDADAPFLWQSSSAASEKASEEAAYAWADGEGPTPPSPPAAVSERPTSTAAIGSSAKRAVASSTIKNDTASEPFFPPSLPWSLPAPPEEDVSSEEFMARIGRLKRSKGAVLPWDDAEEFDSGPRSAASALSNITARLPRPIIQLSLPKSATLTLSRFFACGGVPSRHTHHSGGSRIGDCMLDNLLAEKDGETNKSRPPFFGCDVFNSTHVNRHGRTVQPSNWADGTPIEFYSDVGAVEPRCFYSTLHDGGLEHVARHHPDSTMILIRRDFDSWYDSVKRWGRGRLLGRWRKKCGFRGRSDAGKEEDCAHEDEACWRSFYEGHTEKIRRFALDHLDMTYIEVGLDERTAGSLERYTGIRSGCFEHCRPGKPADPKVDPKTYKRCKPVGENGTAATTATRRPAPIPLGRILAGEKV